MTWKRSYVDPSEKSQHKQQKWIFWLQQKYTTFTIVKQPQQALKIYQKNKT
jgi:hypothetical protein